MMAGSARRRTLARAISRIGVPTTGAARLILSIEICGISTSMGREAEVEDAVVSSSVSVAVCSLSCGRRETSTSLTSTAPIESRPSNSASGVQVARIPSALSHVPCLSPTVMDSAWRVPSQLTCRALNSTVRSSVVSVLLILLWAKWRAASACNNASSAKGTSTMRQSRAAMTIRIRRIVLFGR